MAIDQKEIAMPWRELKPMQQKVLFIADYLRGVSNFSSLCTRYGISRKTGYKWVARYDEQGIEGLEEHSRRPHQCPHQMPYRLRQAIIELRTQGQARPGPKKLQQLLQQRYPNEATPSQTTIHKVLKQAGLIQKQPRKRRVSPYVEPFAPVQEPNDCWSVDFKGQFKLANGRWCYPLTVMDHHSRYLIGCQGLPGVKTLGTQRVFTWVFKEYGLPRRIRSDNGTPFASKATAGLSRLSLWWIRLGIMPERIQAGQPQQNGRHERMHRTLKQETTKPPAPAMKHQQRRFESFQQSYNHERPHEALHQKTPASCYQSSPRPWPDKLPELEYPEYYDVRRVTHCGGVYWRNGLVYVSHLLHDEWVGMDEIDDGIWKIYYGPVCLGQFDIRSMTGQNIKYWSIKV
jgi:putative transposase